VVTVFFPSSSDIYRDRQVVAERLAAATQELPQGIEPTDHAPAHLVDQPNARNRSHLAEAVAAGIA
jgi:hypothetical protein